jgi:ATP-dependent DNA helicase DinG
MFDSLTAIAVRHAADVTGEGPIIEVAAVVYQDGQTSGAFREWVLPEETIDARRLARVGCTDEPYRLGQPQAQVAQALDAFTQADSFALSHGPWLGAAIEAGRFEGFARSILDTRSLARILNGDLVDLTVSGLLKAYELASPENLDSSGDAVSVEYDPESLLDLFSALTTHAMALPLPVLSAIQRMIPAATMHPLGKFFTRVADVRQAEHAAEGNGPYRPGSGLGSDLTEGLVSERLPRARTDVPDPSEYIAVPVDETAATLGAEGALAASLPSFESREGQIDMVRSVTEAFNQSHHLLVEAGTGIGKSLAYLVPAIEWAVTNNTPVVISTNTKNLQSQLFEKDIPLLQRVLGKPFRAALIRGRGNYLCLRKLLHAIDESGVSLAFEERWPLIQVLVWLQHSLTGDMNELVEWDQMRQAGMGGVLTTTSEECAGRACRHYRRCFLRRARAKSLAADIVVANHSLVFAEMGPRSPALPPYQHIVFDEAHNLEEAATRHFSTELSLSRLRFLLRRLGRPGKARKSGATAKPGQARRSGAAGLLGGVAAYIEGGAFSTDPDIKTRILTASTEAAREAHDAENSAALLFETLAELLGPAGRRRESLRLDTLKPTPPRWDQVLQERRAMLEQVESTAKALDCVSVTIMESDPEGLGFHQEYVTDIDALAVSLREFQADAIFATDLKDDNFVYWVERTRPNLGHAKVWAAPVAIGARLCESLYLQKRACIFASATLSVRGSFEFLKQRLGLSLLAEDQIRTIDVGTPYDYADQCRVMVPMFLPEHGAGSDFDHEFGQLLARLFEATQGRALVLFTSYDSLRKARGQILDAAGSHASQVLAQGESGSREAITEAFREDLHSVLLGTHSFWEGVDLAGETLSCLVMARLPFAVFTDPLIAARCEKIEADGGSAFSQYSLPSAVIRFRQGFGRLIRHREDRGIVIVADRRIVSKGYGKWFRASIPASISRCFDADQMLEQARDFLDGGG